MDKGIFKSSTPVSLNIAVLAMALLVIFGFGIRTIGSGELWTHLANGRSMAQQGGVPETDQLSFSSGETELVAPSWLYDKLVYSLWQSAGPGGTTLLHSIAPILAFLILLPLARRWANFPAIAFSLLLCGWLLSFSFNPTPSILTLMFPAIFMALLHGRTRLVYLWTIIPLTQWFWANMFSSFLLGPVLVLLMGVQVYFARGDDQSPHHTSRTYFGLAALCLGVTFINPYGLSLHSHILTSWSSYLQPYTSQWVSPFASQFKNSLPTLLLVITLAVGAIGLITYRGKLPIMLTTIVALTAFLSAHSIRFIQTMAILAFPFICLATQAALNAVSELRKSGVDRNRTIVEYFVAGLTVLLSAVSLWSMAGNSYYTRTGSDRSFGLGIETSALPVEAANIMARPDFPERAINMPVDGGYLAWRLPERKIFIDTRASLYGPEMYELLTLAMLSSADAWSELVEASGIDAILVPCSIDNGGLIFQNIHSKDNWRLVFFDGTSAIFLRDLPELAGIIKDRELRQSGLDILEAERNEYVKRLQSSGRPPNSARLIGAGNVFYATERMKGAISIYSLLTRGAPNMTRAWMLAGIAHARAGEDYAEAVRMLRRACRLESDMPLGWMWLSHCYDELGELGRAISAYERGIELDPQLGASFSKPGDGK